MTEIVLGGLPEFTVPLPDPATDAKRVYRPRAMTKSLETKWEKAWTALVDFETEIEGKERPTAAEKTKYVRLICDCLNILLVGGDVEAGDHIFALREAGTEGTGIADVKRLFVSVLSQSDPT